MKKWKVINSLGLESLPFSIQKLLKILLINRNLKTKKEQEDFFNFSLKDVSLKSVGINLIEVGKALKIIEKTIKESKKIVIYGDYDVDGICGTAILWETIYKLYKNVIPYIPHRVNEGYGLSVSGIDNILSENNNIGLIITVDNGIVAYDAVKHAKENGINIVVTDHHLPGKKKLFADAVIHTTKLCGAGVAYLFSEKINSAEEKDKNVLNTHLELVALATVADLVPLTGANRTLLKFGLEALRKTKRVGLLALFSEAVVEKEKIGTYEIGHIIAPRLNAMGRMAYGMDSLRLICTKDKTRAALLAKKVGETNKDRQQVTEKMRLHAEEISQKVDVSEKIIFIYHKSYNQGIVGLVASRLVEKHYRPSFVVSVGEEFSKGSARSIKGFNIIEFIRTFDKFIIEAGGHPMAAGFTIQTSKILAFKKELEEKGKKIISKEQLTRNLEIDCVLDLDLIDFELYESLQKLAPFGMGNPEPVFAANDIKIVDIRKVGKTGAHTKFNLEQKGKVFDAIAFGIDTSGLKKGDAVDIAYGIEKNEWNGQSSLQLKIKDIGLRN